MKNQTLLKSIFVCILILITYSKSFSQVIDPSDPTNESRWWIPHSGYLNKDSFVPGDTLKFHISNHSSVSSFSITIARNDVDFLEYPNSMGIPVYTSPTLTANDYGVPTPTDSAYKNGPGWDTCYTLIIPSDWTPGMYRAQFLVCDTVGIDEVTRLCNIDFIVRPSVPGSFSDILFVVPFNTFQAYNNWGGKSLEPFESTNGERAYKVSFRRPLNQYYTTDYVKWVEPFRAWLYQQGSQYIPEFADQYDIDAIPGLLANYKMVIFVGHDEYWTRNELNAVKNYVSNGGTVGIFAGNVCWWQVRYENNGNTLVCYKDQALDPFNGVQDSLVTVNFINPLLNYPENQVTGLTSQLGGVVQRGNLLRSWDGWGGYNDLYNTQSWVFRGTSLVSGDTLGNRNPTDSTQLGIVGDLVDGCEFTFQDTIPVVTGLYQTPLTYKILGTSDAWNNSMIGGDYHCVMGMYRTKGGGWAFNAASVYWCNGLETTVYGDYIPEVRMITKNIIDKFIRLSRIP
jgi:N,N-dimethylformamidase beta subunit-like, C-terminal